MGGVKVDFTWWLAINTDLAGRFRDTFPRESLSTSFSSSSWVNFPGPLVSNVITKFVGANHEHIITAGMMSLAGQRPDIASKGRPKGSWGTLGWAGSLGRRDMGYIEPQISPKSIPKAPLELLIPPSYNLLPKGNKCSARNGNRNTNCDTLTNTHPRSNTIPKATPFANCAQVLEGRSDIGRACRVVVSGGNDDIGDGLSTRTTIRWILAQADVCSSLWDSWVVVGCG